jgi:anthranilate/para-aminobenzoate synthase component I
MSDPVPGATLELGWDEFDPATAYAKLRTYTPGRPSFLLESLAPDQPSGRYSIVGYRVQGGETLPPGVDAATAQVGAVATLEAMPSLAQGLAQSAVGFLAYGNTHAIHRMRRWEGETLSGCFMRGAVVVLFDHHAKQVTIAAPRPGKLAERCAWELRNGPDVAPEPVVDADAPPPSYTAEPDADGLAGRAVRARRFLADPEDRLVLAQMLSVPGGDADPWDAYRALRTLLGKPHGFFLDLGQTPLAAQKWMFGASSTVVAAQHRHDGDPPSCDRLTEQLRAAFPHPSLTGSEPVEAAQIIRRLEQWPREELGALVGYLCPGGEACFALAESVTTAEGGAFHMPVPVATVDDLAALASESERAASPGLAAIGAAQQAARRR